MLGASHKRDFRFATSPRSYLFIDTLRFWPAFVRALNMTWNDRRTVELVSSA